MNLLSRFFVVSKAKVRNPIELAQELAYRARYLRRLAMKQIEEESDKGPLRSLYAAFKEALVHDQTQEDFSDAFAQTLTYGLLTARWLGNDQLIAAGERFTRQTALKHLPATSPFLNDLFRSALSVKSDEQRGRLLWLVDDIADLLDRIDVTYVFGAGDAGSDAATDPVIHFYEPFLAAYDKQLKNKRGVFFTPRPVVSCIVRSVHELLQKEFGLEDGLASTDTWGDVARRIKDLKIPEGVKAGDPFVCILDPATGTGTFLFECVEVIEHTMKDSWCRELKKTDWNDPAVVARWNDYVPEHLLPRLYGYELMMASYAVAHLKLSFKFGETGYKLKDAERIRIFLTNSLERPSDSSQQRLAGTFPVLASEAKAVSEIKRNQRFTVVIGNPPYSGESANKIEWIEKDIKGTYQCVDGVPLKEKGKKNWLLDDYVKFLRLSHLTIEATGCGVVGYVVNNAFQDNPTFRGLRHSLFDDFSRVEILDLHGSGTRSDSADAAKGDENVFDILQGVCILLLSRTAGRPATRAVARGDLWGPRDEKYRRLQGGTVAALVTETLSPKPDQWYFISLDLTFEAEWQRCIGLCDAMPINGNGLISAKDHFAYAFSREELERDLEVFLDKRLSDEEVAERLQIRDNSMWSLHGGRLRLRRERSDARFCEVSYRPFDSRHSLFHRDVIFNLRLPVTQHIVDGESLVLLTTRMTKGDEWRHCFVTRNVSDCALLSNKTSTNAFVFPLKRKTAGNGEGLFARKGDRRTYEPNLAAVLLDRLAATLGFSHSRETEEDVLTPENIFHYAYAVFHSPGYRIRFAEFLKIDFPRLPLAGNLELFCTLVRLGSELVALHLLEVPQLDMPIVEFIGGRNPEVEKISWSRDTVWIDKNATCGFKGVLESVWNFHIGAYQVCEKWLKDRKGRTLTTDDIEHYQKIVVVISETKRIMMEIDEVIDEHGSWPAAFVSKPAGGTSTK